MEYKVNLTACGATLFLPGDIADKYLKMINRTALKTLIWIYRNPQRAVTAEEIAGVTGEKLPEVRDALEYLAGLSLILTSGSEEQPVSEEARQITAATSEPSVQPVPTDVIVQPDMQPDTAPQRQVEKITVNPPTHEEVAKRCGQSKDIREIFATTEQRLGKTLSFTMQSVLVMLYDDYGLSAQVIALLIEHSVCTKKVSSKQIANLGKVWCEQEIDTIDKAMEYIETQGTVERYWHDFTDATGVKNPSPTAKQKKFFVSWINEMKFSMQMIVLAYEQMAESTSGFSFPYMNKILQGWKESGITTPEQAAKAQAQFRERYAQKGARKNATAAKSSAEQSDASYDIDAYTRRAFSNPLDIFDKKGE